MVWCRWLHNSSPTLGTNSTPSAPAAERTTKDEESKQAVSAAKNIIRGR